MVATVLCGSVASWRSKSPYPGALLCFCGRGGGNAGFPVDTVRRETFACRPTISFWCRRWLVALRRAARFCRPSGSWPISALYMPLSLIYTSPSSPILYSIHIPSLTQQTLLALPLCLRNS